MWHVYLGHGQYPPPTLTLICRKKQHIYLNEGRRVSDPTLANDDDRAISILRDRLYPLAD